MDLFEELQRVPFFTNQEATSGSQGVFLVMIEMILALVGIILNLTVLISIKEKAGMNILPFSGIPPKGRFLKTDK